MATDRPDVDIRHTFSAASVVFEVQVTNNTHQDLRSLQLTPRPVPEGVPLDREGHRIPLLRPRASRTAAFRMRPGPDAAVVSLDVVVEWEDEAGTKRGRREVSAKPVDLTCPDLHAPREGVERWRAGLRGGSAVEARQRHEAPPEELLGRLEQALENMPGDVTATLEEGPRGPVGRIWVRTEGARGRRAGLLVDVTPDPRTGGSRLLVTVSATTEELLARFYHLSVGALEEVLSGVPEQVPQSLTEE